MEWPSSLMNCFDNSDEFLCMFFFRYSADFGKNEAEVMKHLSNYLEPSKSQNLLDLLAGNQLRVTYQPYDWGING